MNGREFVLPCYCSMRQLNAALLLHQYCSFQDSALSVSVLLYHFNHRIDESRIILPYYFAIQ
jgi:hypothetical protein